VTCREILGLGTEHGQLNEAWHFHCQRTSQLWQLITSNRELPGVILLVQLFW